MFIGINEFDSTKKINIFNLRLGEKEFQNHECCVLHHGYAIHVYSLRAFQADTVLI